MKNKKQENPMWMQRFKDQILMLKMCVIKDLISVNKGSEKITYNRTISNIIKPFKQRNSCTFSTSTRTNKCQCLSGLNINWEIFQDLYVRPTWVVKLDTIEADKAIEGFLAKQNKKLKLSWKILRLIHLNDWHCCFSCKFEKSENKQKTKQANKQI